MVDHLIDRVAGLHHQHDAARAFQQADQFLDGMRADHLRAFSFVGEEVVDFGDGAVEDGYFEAVVIHVENEILTHHGEPSGRCSTWHLA